MPSAAVLVVVVALALAVQGGQADQSAPFVQDMYIDAAYPVKSVRIVQLVFRTLGALCFSVYTTF